MHVDRIRESIIGRHSTINTPFGEMPMVYADYTASGRSLELIEDFIRKNVLPFYANTHTETSFTGAQTTALREEARAQILSAVNGQIQDKVIFCGAGATAAVDKLISIMNLRLPHELSSRYHLAQTIPPDDRPVVFVGPYEHHSNELPWRESIAEVISIPLNDAGQIDQQALEQHLQAYGDRQLVIGSFSAASNVTGIKSDVIGITALLKAYGALSFWDYAAAAPYVGIDINGTTPIDGIFLSPHKFIGGPGTPGVLVIKESLLQNQIPAVVGGGTVVYVTPNDHQFIADAERREEGGTPAIVESIRAGLVFKLQQLVGISTIERKEQDFVERAMARFQTMRNVEILGDLCAPRLSIFSLRFKFGKRDLHYGFVVSLLNDLFGIQVRGGCSCAGPYGHRLLGMSSDYSKAIESEISKGAMILRPGWVRLNFNYFIDDAEFEYIMRAVALVAEHGWRLLAFYHFDVSSGVWRFQGRPRELASSLAAFETADVKAVDGETAANRECRFDRQIDQATTLLTDNDRRGSVDRITLSAKAERLRWFALPREAFEALDREQGDAGSLYQECAIDN